MELLLILGVLWFVCVLVADADPKWIREAKAKSREPKRNLYHTDSP